MSLQAAKFACEGFRDTIHVMRNCFRASTDERTEFGHSSLP